MPHARKRKLKLKTTAKFDEASLLQAVLHQAASRGWTMATLRAAAAAVGAEEGRLELVYPRGVPDAVAAFNTWVNEQMLARIARDRFFTGRRVRDKVAFAVRARLEALEPHREAVRRLLIWGALPLHAPLMLKLGYTACDAIWRKVGDISTDFNFYTKRGLLGFVLKTTLFFWLGDDSADRRATWEFLDRRIAEVLRVGQMAGRLKEMPAWFGRLSGLAHLILPYSKTL